ncbi:MOSC domain-containing protein [Nocardioides sp. URHA0020]|uniref:MOSC domain-containing protein n=1 Tax=Nocardioides sp. URHA0020 TaxID=1380392 RepID=UPI0004919DA3|nr:MOSC N-terminal beta barrel domain-containing protein [Nocardioides sp. URHA0020]
MSLSLTSIHRYPVKSCRGESVPELLVEPWGLSGDRRWMLVDASGAVITAREVNRLVLVDPAITPYGLVVNAPDLPELVVPVPDPAAQTPVELWESHLTAAAAGAEADAWFSKAMGRTARLVHLDDPTRRPTSPDFSEPDDRVSFADGYPLLLATEESLAALNDVVLERATDPAEPLPMTRFRPNVVVAGAPAWAEDDWRRIRIGEATFRAVKGCARCVLTTIDPETAVRGKEPIASLARVRRWDGKTWFGINLVPDTAGVTVRVGDAVEVLDAVPAGGGPIRP